MKKSSICGIAASAILLASCATTSVEPAEVALTTGAYTGTWESVELVNNGTAVTGAVAEFTFANPSFKFSGNSGVNQYFGSFELDGTTLTVNPEETGSTLMMGEAGAAAFEQAYLPAFLSCTKAVLIGENLVLSSDTAVIEFAKNADGVWETVSVTVNGEALEGGKATFDFAENYAIDGNAGVNQFFCDAVTHGSDFAVNPEQAIGSTKMMGPAEAQAFEDALFTVLPTLDSISLEGDKLTISNDTSKIVFTKKVSE